MAILHDLQSLQGKPIELQRQALGQWAETLLSAFRTPLPLEGLELTISISLGVHLLDSAQDDGSEALKCADLAMVRAKGKRHRQIVVFDRQHDSADLNSYQLYVDLIQAIQDQQLTMLFQPIFGPSGQVHAVEALARWTHPQLGVIPTETFLALAEQHRDMVFLGEELLRLALEGFRRIHARDASIRLALNLHPSKLLDPELVSRLLARLEQIHLPSSCLTVELTEQSVLEPGPAVERNLRQLREQGISLSLDDFGTGYSSLVLISRLRPDELKIDRSFAQAMLRDDYASQIVSLITTMAGSLDLELVAEGVDSAEVLEALRALGVQRFQGFLLARPMPEAELLERLDGRGSTSPTLQRWRRYPRAELRASSSDGQNSSQPSPCSSPTRAAPPIVSVPPQPLGQSSSKSAANCRIVFALPLQEAGPPLPWPARQPEISSSLASSSHTAQRGRLSWAASQSSGALIRILSVRGSSRAPHTEPPPARRASQPSAASLMPPAAAATRPGPASRPPGPAAAAGPARPVRW